MSINKTRIEVSDTVIVHIDCTKTNTVITLIDAYIGDMPPVLATIFEDIRKQLAGSNKGMYTR